MLWQQWVILIWLFIASIATILMIGERRDPITPKTATVNILFAVILAWVIASI